MDRGVVRRGKSGRGDGKKGGRPKLKEYGLTIERGTPENETETSEDPASNQEDT